MLIDDESNNSDIDDGSLFGSPPPSPVRGRSPAFTLALPSGGGDCTTQNVGTIALPGSHLYSELPVTTPALSLSGSSHHELSQRPPALNMNVLRSMQSRPQPQALPVRTDSSQSGKRKRSSGENSTAPRPAPPPIHLPDPDAPPPPNFLRNQQALLGLAGLVGKVHPATLSATRTARGSNSSNPIVIDDLAGASIGLHNRCATVDFSKLPPPSNEEVIACLIRDKNVFPVLQSIQKLIASGTAFAPAENDSGSIPHNIHGAQQLPNGKRRKVDKVPAGVADWDVPYPPQDGSDGELERQRGRELIVQLVGLIKNAARKAALRAYQRRQDQSRERKRQQSRPHSQQAIDTEPKIRGHYRPITATYGLPGAHEPGVLVDHSNINSDVSVASPASYNVQPSPVAHSDTAPSNSFTQLFPLTLTGSPAPTSSLSRDDGKSISEWSEGLVTPSETSSSSTPDFDQNTFDSWLSILNAFPQPLQLADDGYRELSPSVPTFCHDVDSFMASITNSFPMQNSPDSNSFTFDHSTQHSDPANNNGFTSFVNHSPDFAIDPILLAMSIPPSSQPQSQLQHFDSMSPVPALSASPVDSTGSSAAPFTPHVDYTMGFNEPDIFADQQDGNSLLHHASTTLALPSPDIFNTSTCPPSQTQLRATSSAPLSRASTEGPAAPDPKKIHSHIALRSMQPVRALNKQDVLKRARERRRQLVGEIDRAKVELWETTIEQGVLAQLVKGKL